jgi:hypothetical protein
MVAICNGRFTSTPTVPFARIPVVRRARSNGEKAATTWQASGERSSRGRAKHQPTQHGVGIGHVGLLAGSSG